MKIQTERETVQHTRIQLNGKDILRMLAAANKLKITRDTVVVFTVPSGADYSGQTLEISDEYPITVTSKSYDKKHLKKPKAAK